jgi:hypothetical protein
MTERAAEMQLSRCRVLAEAVSFASKALAHAGTRLQDGAHGFRTGETSDVPLAGACRGLVGACGDLGATFTYLADTLVGEILDPLQEVQKSVEAERESRRAGLNELEKEDGRCMKAQSESERKRDKITQDLHNQMRDREEVLRRGGWFMRSTLLGKMDRQIKRTAQLQKHIVDELATKSNDVALAKFRVAQGADELQGILADADARLKKVLQPLLMKCAHAWRDMSQAIHKISEKLQIDANSLRYADYEGHQRLQDGSESSVMDPSESSFREEGAVDVGSGCKRSSGTAVMADDVAIANLSSEPVLDGMSHATAAPESLLDEMALITNMASPPVTQGLAVPAAEAPKRLEASHFRIGGLTDDSMSESSMSCHSDDSSDVGAEEALLGEESCEEPGTTTSNQDAAYTHGDATDMRCSKQEEFMPDNSDSQLPDSAHDSTSNLEFVAPLSQGPLGLKLTWPPGAVNVLVVVPGGWADSVGIQEGVEILTVNGEVVALMQEGQLRELLRLRPLHLTVSPAKRAVEVVQPSYKFAPTPDTGTLASSGVVADEHAAAKPIADTGCAAGDVAPTAMTDKL